MQGRGRAGRGSRPELWELFRAALEAASLVFVAKAQKIEMDKLEKAKKERTKVSHGQCSLPQKDRCWSAGAPLAEPRACGPRRPARCGGHPEQPSVRLVDGRALPGFQLASAASLWFLGSCPWWHSHPPRSCRAWWRSILRLLVALLEA